MAASAYEAPQMVEVGNFRELTQATAQGGWFDILFGSWF
ncbi:lasso RiPP family leader peptide-containing protein [Microbacterium sp.]|nr:lasso RiPP family leader peptide-containing protein [Microbacterium sp.]MDP3949531.1 lasso RiPP family leader peptide-containing protein [Microbacterium sp.]